MLVNRTKARLAEREVVLGCFLRYPDAALAELIALQGWDFVVIDAEHGTAQPRDVEHLVRATELRGTTPLVRIPANDAPVLLRHLDTGAHGVHVPWVSSADDARRAVAAVKYYPEGRRGLAGTRAADFGQSEPLDAYVARANRETLVVVQVETAGGVERIDEIAAVEGVDVVFVGPTDLAHSLGHPGRADHPDVVAAIDRVVNAVARTPVALGSFVATAEAAVSWRQRGARYLATTLEAMLAPAMRTFLTRARPG